MAEKPNTKGITQAERVQAVWEALSSLLGGKDVSIQLYTSKRHRTWVSIKQWSPARYTTAVECLDPGSPVGLAIAMGAASYLHVAKRRGVLPLTDTWHQADELKMDDERLAAWLDAGELPELDAEPEPL
jgi:hypothetical protein